LKKIILRNLLLQKNQYSSIHSPLELSQNSLHICVIEHGWLAKVLYWVQTSCLSKIYMYRTWLVSQNTLLDPNVLVDQDICVTELGYSAKVLCWI